MLVASSRKKFSTNSHKNFVYSFQTLLGICFFLDRPTAFRFQLKTNYFALLYSLAPEPGSVYQMALTLTLRTIGQLGPFDRRIRVWRPGNIMVKIVGFSQTLSIQKETYTHFCLQNIKKRNPPEVQNKFFNPNLQRIKKLVILF